MGSAVDRYGVDFACGDREIVCRYGLFEVLVSDRGGVFVGTLAAHVFRALKIKRIQTTAYHPQANGMIERFHATLKITLVLWSHECSDGVG